MTSLMDTFRSPEARVQKVVVAIDLKNSTAIKEQEAEASWLTSYGWFFEQIRTGIRSHSGGTLVKFLGDGAMAVFGDDDAADAINWAIELQETMADAQEQKRISRSFDCSVGLARSCSDQLAVTA